MDTKRYLEEIQVVIDGGPYTDTWESLAQYPMPKWYNKARLGIFIHWGLYSVPAYFMEWYPRLMYYRQNPVFWHHKKNYGRGFNYHDFAPMFTAEKFDAGMWLEKISACGADFVMPVAEHHDGFKLYESSLNRWNSVEMGPKRDILAEIKQAASEKGVRFSASSHRAEHFWFMNGGKTIGFENATTNEELRDFYGPCVSNSDKNNLRQMLKNSNHVKPTTKWLEDWLMSSCEIIDKYKPETFYFDFWAAEESFRPYVRKFLAYFYNKAHAEGREVVFFNKVDDALFPCGAYICERGQIEGLSLYRWQCETSTAYNSWSYCTTNKFKPVEEIACNMVDVWSKNGCMALNIGPKADGTLCDEEIAILDTLASWLEKNREAIWNTSPYRIFGEGKRQKSGAFKEKYKYGKKDFRFTYSLGKIYAFALNPAGQKSFRINSIAEGGVTNAAIRSVEIVGEDRKVNFNSTKKYLDLFVDEPLTDSMPACFKISVE